MSYSFGLKENLELLEIAEILKSEYAILKAKYPRAWIPCPSFRVLGLSTASQLISTCQYCGRYFACCHNPKYERLGAVCHRNRVIFIDGSCLQNGAVTARSGIGCAIGTSDEDQIYLAVDDDVDDSSRPGVKRCGERAELLAAIQGIAVLAATHRRNRVYVDEDGSDAPLWIIVSDSKYLVTVMSEALPVWKTNQMRTGKGKTPANLDLFLKIEELIEEEERDKSIKIVFWHVPRGFNTVADKLAKKGAAAALPVNKTMPVL